MSIQSSRQYKTTRSQCGFGLIEIVVATAVATLTLSAFLYTGAIAVRLLRAEKENLEAALLAKEGLDAVRVLRDEAWSTIASTTIGIAYYPIKENGKWKLTTLSPGQIDGKFSRSVMVDRVYRNASDQISATGTEDDGTRKITLTMLWGAHTYQLTSYFTNFQSFLNLPTESQAIYFEDAPTDTNFANFPSPNTGSGDPGQSFTTGPAIQATKIEILLRRVTITPSHVYAEIRTSPTGSILGTTNSINGTTIASSSPSWVELRFEIPISLASSTEYVIRLRSNPPSTDAGSNSQGTINWSYRQTLGSPYAGGKAYTGIGQFSNPADSGTLQTDYDFGFRIFTK